MIAAQDLVGLSVSPAARHRLSLQAWHFSKSRRDKPSYRKLRRSAKLECEGKCSELIQAVRQHSSWQGRPEPRRICVVVNPVSGQGKAPRIYETQVAPVWEAAGLAVQVHTTRRSGDGVSFASKLDLQAFDALVAVGGDGTLHELLQGLMQRPDWKAAVRLPLAMIPGGTSGALAFNCGIPDAATGAYAVCKGCLQGLDIFSVIQPPRQRWFGFLSITFGGISNLDVGTEQLRWMGSARYTVGALKEAFAERSYLSSMAFLTSAAAEGLQAQSNTPGPQQDAEPWAGWGPPCPFLTPLGPLAHLDLGSAGWLPKEWVRLASEGMSNVVVSNLPHLDKSALTAPHQGHATGSVDLMYTLQMGWKTSLELMLKIEHGTHVKMSGVQTEPIVAMAFEPIAAGTMLVLDGERIPYQPIFVEVHSQLCQVIVCP